MVAVLLVAVAIVAVATGFGAGVLFRGQLLDALARAVEAEQRCRRDTAYQHRPRERLKPGAIADRDPPTERELRLQREELLAAKLEAGRAIEAERAAFTS